MSQQAEDKDKDVVWMHCRAKPDNQIDAHKPCQGNQAKVVFRKPRSMMQGGGSITRYRCLTCNGVWHITL